jgi:hypothetical protein
MVHSGLALAKLIVPSMGSSTQAQDPRAGVHGVLGREQELHVARHAAALSPWRRDAMSNRMTSPSVICSKSS